jgi:hypothetical protein
VLVPGAEASGPAAWYVHPPHQGLLAAEVAPKLDGTIDQKPPEVGVFALMEQLHTGLDPNLRTGTGQVVELLVTQPVEQLQRAKVATLHRFASPTQTVAR